MRSGVFRFQSRMPVLRRKTAKTERPDTRWQLIFGFCLVAAVIIAVIILITTTLGGDYQTAQASPSPSETLTPSPSPTATPTPTPTVESITITFLGQPIANSEFSTRVGNTTQLGTVVYPLEVQGTVTWSTDDETRITVENGLVTAVGAGWATVIARCYGQAAECKVLVQ